MLAAQVSFVDQSHFARYFKRQVGVPPSQFRTNGKNIVTKSRIIQDGKN
jgi:AraC-like DNA-binding protein